ncbi:SDR family oxidoreductase [Pseudonocardia ailaonensis]|uniref:SDR family NAD(P)-dependent oxidoreductase n=1 Tax=Pseudonocardia ailaonensis TaxID=367279 RepID=UPI0031D20373
MPHTDRTTTLKACNALVTGASQSISAAIAQRFAAAGANRCPHRPHHELRRQPLAGGLDEAVFRCARHGTVAVPLVADLTDEADRSQIVDLAAAQLGGPVDILVNNAAAGIHLPAAEMAPRHRRLMFEVNFHAPVDLAQAAIPGMRARGGG